MLDSVEMNWSVDTKWVILAQPAITCSKLTIETLKQRGEICSKLTVKTLEHFLLCFSVFI